MPAVVVWHIVALRFIVLAMRVLGVLLVTFGAPWIWALRDGLGPGMVESHGAKAVARFVEGFYLVAVLAFGLLIVAKLLSRVVARWTQPQSSPPTRT
jgi:hypothetical protein